MISAPTNTTEHTAFDIRMKLTVCHGDTHTQDFVADRYPVLIGRDEQAHLTLSGLWVGKTHAEIQATQAGLRVIDHGTLAGTQVNGRRITEYSPLSAGDVIAIGPWSMEVQELGHAMDLEHIQQAHLAADAFDTQDIQKTAQQLRSLIDLRRKDWHGVNDEVIRAECKELLVSLVLPEVFSQDFAKRERFIERVIADSVGLGPLEELLEDPEITEIMVNAPDCIFIERHGRCEKSSTRFVDEGSLRSVIDRIVSSLGRRIDDASPMVDARLSDGSRINAVISPLARQGSCLTVRRFSRQMLTARDLIGFGSGSARMFLFLKLAVLRRLNILVSGGTGSGKTTLLNILSLWIPAHERLITIEDAAELRLCHENLVSLEVRQANAEGSGHISIRDLLRNSLRMRPDRIIVGECRGAESIDMLQAMNTGHEGSLTTVHANSPRDALSRLETMILMAGFDLPLHAIREQVASALDLVIQQQRCSDGKRRVVAISEVTGVESGVIQTQEIFRWNPQTNQFAPTGIFPQCAELMEVDQHLFDPEHSDSGYEREL